MVLVLKCLAHQTGEDDDDVHLLARQLVLGAVEVLHLVEQTAGARWLTRPYGGVAWLKAHR